MTHSRARSILIVLALVGVVSLWLGAEYFRAESEGVSHPHEPESVSVPRPDESSAAAAAVRTGDSLAAPGPPSRRHISTLHASPEPLASRRERELAAARAGDAVVAGSLARELMHCASYLKSIGRRSANVAVAMSAGKPEAQIRAAEDQLLQAVEPSLQQSRCEGIDSVDDGEIDDLLRIAVEGGDVDSNAAYLDRGLRQDRLLEYLRDPAAREAFRRSASEGLAEGVRRCHATSFLALGDSYARGLLGVTDLSQAFTYELLANWAQGIDPETHLPLQRYRAQLSAAQLQRALGQAHQAYARYCQ